MKKLGFLFSLCSVGLISGCAVQNNNAETENHTNTVQNELSPGIPYPDNSIPEADNITEQNVAAIIPEPQARVVKADIYTSAYDPNPEVVRYGRYTLVSSKPEGGQKYLLEQLVNVNMRTKKGNYPYLSVEQGMMNTLKGTGYSLCHLTEMSVRNLFSLPLPHVHYQFGEMPLREAMQMLAGEAFELTVNDSTRQLCFNPRHTVPEMPKPKQIVEAGIDEDDLRR